MDKLPVKKCQKNKSQRLKSKKENKENSVKTAKRNEIIRDKEVVRC